MKSHIPGVLFICIDKEICKQWNNEKINSHILEFDLFVLMKKSVANNVRGEAKWTNQEKHLSREKTKTIQFVQKLQKGKPQN